MKLLLIKYVQHNITEKKKAAGVKITCNPPSNKYICIHIVYSLSPERPHFHFSLSCIGEGNGNPFQCSCLENPRDRDGGAWWAAIYVVTQSRTRLKRLSSSSRSMSDNFATPCTPDSFVRGISQVRILEWVAICFSNMYIYLHLYASVSIPSTMFWLSYVCLRKISLKFFCRDSMICVYH